MVNKNFNFLTVNERIENENYAIELQRQFIENLMVATIKSEVKK